MARRKNVSILGDWVGTIGPVVLGTWYGIPTMRSRPVRKKSTKPSEAQLEIYDVFRTVMDFLATFKHIINIGFVQPRKPKMSPLNMATSYHLLHAVVSDGPQTYIDFSKVKFSKPIKTTQQAWNTGMVAEPGMKITVRWELNPYPKKGTELDDRVIFVFFDKTKREYWTRHQSSTRSSLEYTLNVSDSYIGDEIAGFMFLVSADGKLVSETEYLGTVVIMPE